MGQYRQDVQRALETLGLSAGASEEQMRHRYWSLARQLHPDVVPGAGRPERQRWECVVAAYEFLRSTAAQDSQPAQVRVRHHRPATGGAPIVAGPVHVARPQQGDNCRR